MRRWAEPGQRRVVTRGIGPPSRAPVVDAEGWQRSWRHRMGLFRMGLSSDCGRHGMDASRK
eukprot:4636374-Amphidinium_carterae.1